MWHLNILFFLILILIQVSFHSTPLAFLTVLNCLLTLQLLCNGILSHFFHLAVLYYLTSYIFLLSVKSCLSISHIRCLYKTDVLRTVSVPFIRDLTCHQTLWCLVYIRGAGGSVDISDPWWWGWDGPWNVNFIQTPDMADSPRGLHWI